MELSAKRLKTYLECPRKFQFAYIDQIPSPLPASLAFGKAIHAVIEQFHIDGLDENSSIKMFRQIWRRVIEEERPIFSDRRWTPERYERLAEKILLGYINRHRFKPSPLLVEFEFVIPFGEHSFHGVIDRIDEGEGGLVVVDLKSEKSKPSKAELDTDLQFTVYTFAVNKLFGLPVEKCVYYHLRTNEELVTHRDLDRCQLVLSEVTKFVVQNIQSGFFPPNRGIQCRWCPFSFLCEQDPEWANQSPLGGNLPVPEIKRR
ncbi:MAG: PD-(D/E)XK nuclease family protein [Candidatus Bathyarchaeia archaeon]